jgi:hypothetical protein
MTDYNKLIDELCLELETNLIFVEDFPVDLIKRLQVALSITDKGKKKAVKAAIDMFMEEANEKKVYTNTEFYTPELAALGYIYVELMDVREAVNIVMQRQEIEQMEKDLAREKLSDKWHSGKKIRRPQWIQGDYISQRASGEWFWGSGERWLFNDDENIDPDGWEIYKEEE